MIRIISTKKLERYRAIEEGSRLVVNEYFNTNGYKCINSHTFFDKLIIALNDILEPSSRNRRYYPMG